jgi:hypothetical protein
MRIFERWYFGLSWDLRLVIELWYLEGFWFLSEDFFEDCIFAWWNISIYIILPPLVHHAKISQSMALQSALLVFSESSQWVVWVHPLGLRLVGATVWKLLIIEPFSQWKLNKIKSKLKTVLEFEGVLGVVAKPSASQI